MKGHFNFMAGAKKALAVVIALGMSATAYADDYFKRISMEGVELVSSVTWGKVDINTYMTPGLYEFGYDNRFMPDKTAPLLSIDALGGCVYHDGKIYANEFSSRSQYEKPMWRIYDAKTYTLLSEHTLKDNCECTTTSLAYDPTADCIYGFDETYTETYVVRVDPETGEMTRLGDMQDRNYKFFAMACSPKGELFCTYLNKQTNDVYLGRIRKSDGKVAMIRGINATNLLPGDSFINSTYDQAMFFNNSTGKLYWMFQSSSMYLYKSYVAMFEVNTTTAEASLVAYIEDELQGPGAFFIEPAMKAPAIVEDFDWTTDSPGANSGTISMTMPKTAYDGTPLNGKQKLVILKGSIPFVEEELEPGEKFSKRMENMRTGWQDLNIYVSNAAGDGPTILRPIFAGYDTPKAPSNVKLTAEGLHTTLTWDAPTIGVDGHVIDKASLTYTVVRYPGEVTVSEKQKECSFEEDHPGDMTRYVYKVTAWAGKTKGETAMSNNIVIGTPLDVPYDGTFKTAADMYNYFTILDENHDNYTWAYDIDNRLAVYSYSQENSADDWLISPPINYKKGKSYTLSFSAFSSSKTYKESLAVTFGADKTPVAQEDVLLSLNELSADTEEDAPQSYSVDFTVPEDGVYYFAFYACSERFREYLRVKDIKVTEKGATAVHSLASDGDVTVKGGDGVLEVRLANTANVRVYNLAGRLMADYTGTELHMPLPKGVYMVVAGNSRTKVVVK